ncbi:MAG: hybrid sensor histidine kinase/response regulator [Calditrichaeota bacterium]|nr:MAG: hybrid sensor histidine kinase/response regulator [Calditrichota bacterium]
MNKKLSIIARLQYLFFQLLIFIFTSTQMHGQAISQPAIGLPFLQNFSPKDYEFHPQNWAIVQNSQGIIFFANTAGLLEFDGVNWRQHELFKNLTIASLAIDDEGTIFVGGRGEFGYLQPDSIGQFAYVSLTKFLSDETIFSTMIWEICATSHGIYFRSGNNIFRWNGADLKSWETKTSYGYLAAVRDTVFVLEKGVGLQTLNGDSLQLIAGGEQFSNTTMYVILPFGVHSKVFLGTRTNGIYVYDGTGITRFKTAADGFFSENRLYHGVRLSSEESRWALATTRGGLVVLDSRGQIRQLLSKEHGLPDNKIHFVFEDRQKALWLSLNNGISRAEISSPFSIFDQRIGIDGTPHTVTRHNGKLFVGTNRGLFYADEMLDHSQIDSGKNFLPRFKPVAGIAEQVWSLHSSEDLLFVGAANGIFGVREKKAEFVAKLPVATYCFYQPTEKDVIYAGARNGLLVLQRDKKNWHMAGKIAGISEEIRTIAPDRNDASLWLGTPYQGLLQIQIVDKALLNPAVYKYSEKHGLPEGMAYVYSVDGQIKIGTYKGLYFFDHSKRLFFPDSTLGAFLADSRATINRLQQDQNGNIWVMAGTKKNRLNRGVRKNGGYTWSKTPFQRLIDVNFIMDIFPEKSGIVWLVGRDEKVYRLDSNFTSQSPEKFPAFVRRVSTVSTDSLIWGGSTNSVVDTPELDSVLPFKNNSLRFEYAMASYDAAPANQYQIMLEGYDDNFLPWTTETKKDYTGLPSGDYIFRVRGQNIYEQESSEGNIAFTILSPWYQSWWASLFYVILTVFSIVLIVKTRVRHLEKKTAQLENLIDERTAVIREQSEKLQELARMRSQFFANISHEFRTPLTLILGPLEDMLDRAKASSDKKNLGLMQRHARRVLQLINQLLDLSRLESGKLKLKASRGDLAAFIKGIVMSFASLAEQKKINLRYLLSEKDASELAQQTLFFDRDQIEKVFYNLLSNAFKFTFEGGTVQVEIVMSQGGNFVEIKVKDSGIGIRSDRLASIFERFYQVSSGSTKEYQGTGIGLALTKELVELHHGEITVGSEVGKGTEVVVKLPVGKAYFAEDEMASPSVSNLGNLSDLSHQIEHSFESAEGPNQSIEFFDDDIPVILVVDDHLDVRNYIRSHLESKYRVVDANNGEEGVKKAAEIIPDMVISDVMMPKMDGYKLCDILKMNEKTSHIPVILLTAKAGEQDKISGLQTGADDYLTKPFNSKELHVRVHNLIEMRRKLQHRFYKDGLLQPREINVTSVEEAFLARMMDILEENLSEEDFGVESLSSALHIGRRQLHRKIKAITGETPTDFIRSVRLQRAKNLLEQKSGTVSEICFQTGFGSLSYFSKAFKDQFGQLPSEV